MKAILKVNNKEIEVDITKEELKRLKSKPSRKRWRAKKYGECWHITEYGTCYSTTDTEVISDDEKYELGNYFGSKEEAIECRNRLAYTQQLKDYIYENDDKEVDWTNRTQIKYFLVYDYVFECLSIDRTLSNKTQGAVYATNSQVLKDAVNYIGKENIEKYIFGIEI